MLITLIDNSTFTTGVNATAITATVPATIMPGDYLLFGINVRGTNTTTTTTPAGFTSLVDIARGTTGRHYVFGKVATGNETTVSSTCTLTSNHSAILLLFRGTNTTNPVNITGSDSGTSVAAHPAPSITTTTNGCFIVHFANSALIGTFNYSWSPGTAIVQAKSTVGGVDNVLGAAYLTQPIAGATGTDVATMSSSTNFWATSSIALAPLPGSGGLTGVSVLQGISTLQF